MTKLVARLVLAMMVLPFSGTLVILAMAAFASRGVGGPPPAMELVAMWAVVYGFITLYWILVWRDVVQWTTRRRALTAPRGWSSLPGVRMPDRKTPHLEGPGSQPMTVLDLSEA